MNWLYFRIIKEPFSTNTLFKKDFDEILTDECLKFLKQNNILCKKLERWDLWWWWDFQNLLWLFSLKSVIPIIIKFIPIFLNSLKKLITEYITNNVIKDQFTITLTFNRDKLWDYYDYNQQIIFLNQIWLFLHKYLKDKYCFLNIWININLYLWYFNLITSIYIKANQVSEKNVTKINNHIKWLLLEEWKSNVISISWLFIKRNISNVKFMKNSWWCWEWKSKNLYFLFSSNTMSELLKKLFYSFII